MKTTSRRLDDAIRAHADAARRYEAACAELALAEAASEALLEAREQMMAALADRQREIEA